MGEFSFTAFCHPEQHRPCPLPTPEDPEWYIQVRDCIIFYSGRLSSIRQWWRSNVPRDHRAPLKGKFKQTNFSLQGYYCTEMLVWWLRMSGRHSSPGKQNKYAINSLFYFLLSNSDSLRSDIEIQIRDHKEELSLIWLFEFIVPL